LKHTLIKSIILSILLLLASSDLSLAATTIRTTQHLDSLETVLKSELGSEARLAALHTACSLLYKQDIDHVLLFQYAKEGVILAQEQNDIEKGSDLAVWILRANIYLRSYDRNPPYYKYLKDLFHKGLIEKNKIVQPLYSEIYSYLEYGKLREAEEKMLEYEKYTDKDNPQQLAYYLDMLAVFKRKANDLESAAKTLKEFASITTEIKDKRFLATALSRNAEFYLIDSLNYYKSKVYAEKALDVIKEHDLKQFQQHLLLQLCQALYKLGETDAFDRTYSQISIDSFAKDNKIIHKDYLTFSGDINFDKKEYLTACKHYRRAVQFLENSDFATMEQLTQKIEKCYVRMDDYRTAFVYSNRLNVLKDSLYNVQNIKAEKFFQSELRMKDSQTEKIKLENKIYAQKKSTIFIGFFASLILLSLLFYNRILDEKVKLRTEALDAKNRELKDSLEELEQFNYIASHDIKEPMRVVSSVTGLIEKKLKKENNEKYKKEFSLVKSSISQLYTLIEDLSQFLDFKAKTITHQLIDTNVLTGHITQLLHETIKEKNGTIELGTMPEIYSSNSLLTVIFKNLIENGLKYNKNDNPKVKIDYAEIDNRHVFSFTDNGIGIEEKYHSYIFQMFKRLENRKNTGSGLGLGLVSKAVEKLDGEIKLESSLGQGSSFKVYLPKNYIAES